MMATRIKHLYGRIDRFDKTKGLKEETGYPLIMIKPTVHKKHVGAMSVIDMYWTLSELSNGDQGNGRNTHSYR